MKKLLILLIWIISCNLYCLESQLYIPKASYYVIQKATGVRADELVESQFYLVDYYQFNGKFIETIHFFNDQQLSSLKFLDSYIDVSAPKPQPVKCKIVIWPEIYPNTNMGDSVSDEFAVFYDRHNNLIANYRYNEDKDITLKSLSKQKIFLKLNNKYLTINDVLDLSNLEVIIRQ